MRTTTLCVALAIASVACKPDPPPPDDPSNPPKPGIKCTVFVGMENSIEVFRHEQVGTSSASTLVKLGASLPLSETPQALIWSGNHLHAVVGQGVTSYALNLAADPVLTLSQTLPAGTKPVAAAMGGVTLYVLNFGAGDPQVAETDSTISVYYVTDKGISHMQTTSATDAHRPRSALKMAVAGGHLFVAGRNFCRFPIQSDGSLATATCVPPPPIQRPTEFPPKPPTVPPPAPIPPPDMEFSNGLLYSTLVGVSGGAGGVRAEAVNPTTGARSAVDLVPSSTVQDDLVIGRNPVDIAISLDGSLVFVAHQGGISVVAPATPGQPHRLLSTANFGLPSELCVEPTGQWLFALDTASRELTSMSVDPGGAALTTQKVLQTTKAPSTIAVTR